MAKDKNEAIENKATDPFPPGSGTPQTLGTPQKAVEASKGEKTAAPLGNVESEDSPKFADKVIQTVPYEKPNPLADARRSLISQIKNAPSAKVRSKREKGEKILSPRAIALLIRSAGSANEALRGEIEEVLSLAGMEDTEIQEQFDALARHPELFAGDQKPGNLQVLSLPPGAQKPPEFDAAPGTTAMPDTRYWPSRFALPPDEDDYEDGDLIYVVHEDSSYTVLSVGMQTAEWQSTHHLPPMNLISKVGGGDIEELPKVAKKGAALINRKDVSKRYDEKTAEAK
jgi:hypothetical protein